MRVGPPRGSVSLWGLRSVLRPRGHGEKVASAPEGPHRNLTLLAPGLGPPASRTVRNKTPPPTPRQPVGFC